MKSCLLIFLLSYISLIATAETPAAFFHSATPKTKKTESEGRPLICENLFQKNAELRIKTESIFRDISKEIPLDELLAALAKTDSFKKYLRSLAESQRENNINILMAFSEVALTKNSDTTLAKIPLIKKIFEEQIELKAFAPECTEAAIADVNNTAQSEASLLLDRIRDPEKKPEESMADLNNWFLETKNRISEAYTTKDYREIELLKAQLAMLGSDVTESSSSVAPLYIAELKQKLVLLNEFQLLNSNTPLVDKFVLFSSTERAKMPKEETTFGQGKLITL
ncbi:MAG: hypothetical protein R3A80_06760 [Bdellovibrionota bacterium]